MLFVPKIFFREGDAVQKRLLKLSLKASLFAIVLAILPIGAGAAGLGKITVLSGLGQPLRAEIELRASREEFSTITARLASHDAFRQAGIEYVPVLSGINVTIEKRPSGASVIRLGSERPVNEPFLDLLIELSWASGRLVREYTFLLDPAPDVLAPGSRPIRPLRRPFLLPGRPNRALWRPTTGSFRPGSPPKRNRPARRERAR